MLNPDSSVFALELTIDPIGSVSHERRDRTMTITHDLYKTTLCERLKTRRAHVAVVGLGYVGMPLAIAFTQAGYQVTGIDISENKITSIAAGDPGTPDVDLALLRSLLHEGRLSLSSDFSVICSCDALSVCVPTPLRKTGDPDMSYIVSATEAIIPYLHPGMVFVLESTTYPGTTSEIIVPLIRERAPHLTIGVDLFVAFSPERVDPGRADWTTTTTPKVIGGQTLACLDAALAFYGSAIDTLVPVSSTETAEMVKLLENTFRSVNIGLANEVLLMCDKLGLDAWEVIEAAATKPFGFMKFTPGPGLGGHCIPIDPLYLSWKLKMLNYDARFIDLASEINAAMPRYWVQKVQDTLNEVGRPVKGSAILIVGVAYKKDVSDTRESPALDVIHLLQQKGADVHYHDPHVPALQHQGLAMTCEANLVPALEWSDCTVIVTDHSHYDWSLVRRHARCLVDTRRAVAGSADDSSTHSDSPILLPGALDTPR